MFTPQRLVSTQREMFVGIGVAVSFLPIRCSLDSIAVHYPQALELLQDSGIPGFLRRLPMMLLVLLFV